MNQDIENIKGSASMDLISEAETLRELGVDIIGLAGGEPDFDTPKVIKDKAIEEIVKGNTHYAVGKGLSELRKRIAYKLKENNGINVSHEGVIVTPGSKMAIYLTICACISPGEEVLVPTPSWVSYTEIVRATSGVPIEVPLNPDDGYAIKKAVLERYVNNRTRMIILCSPNNPTGRMINEQEIRELIEITHNRNIIILSDEVYEKISYIDRVISPGSFKELSDKTITVNGFSKAYAMTGWRVGYLAGAQKYIDVINKLYTHAVTCTSPFIQEAAIVALDCEREVASMLKEYTHRKEYFVNRLNDIPGIEVIEPEGAFYAWCKFPNIENPAKELLKNAKVIGVPGNAYGTGFDKYVRFSFASSMEELERAINRIEQWLSKK